NPNSILLFLPKSLLSSPSLLRLTPPNSLHLRLSKSLTVSSSLASPPPPPILLSNSTRTLSSLLTLALSVSNAAPTMVELAKIRNFQGILASTMGPLFFTALKDRPSGYLNTPLTIVASSMAKWLDIYCGVFMVKVLLNWFPNIAGIAAMRALGVHSIGLFLHLEKGLPLGSSTASTATAAVAINGLFNDRLSPMSSSLLGSTPQPCFHASLNPIANPTTASTSLSSLATELMTQVGRSIDVEINTLVDF
uniref:YlmG homolog protein 1-2, chloroplastic-like n=1 Tax=Elaeis guineensis var. tenera TaxID=51953 RepID=A0A6J0PP43_ELAGV